LVIFFPNVRISFSDSSFIRMATLWVKWYQSKNVVLKTDVHEGLKRHLPV
jgi:hypothetical protein